MNDSDEIVEQLLSNVSQAQLLYIVQRIKQLAFVAPEKAKELLTANPKLSLALLHAEYLVGARTEKLLPLTSDEVKLAKERLYQMRHPGGGLQQSYASSSVTPASAEQTKEVASALAKLDSSILASITGGSEVLDMEAIVTSLFKLSDEEIAQLPEEVQVVLLNALQNMA